MSGRLLRAARRQDASKRTCVDPKLMISKVVSLDDLPAVFEGLREANTETKVHVSPWGR